MAPIHQTHTNPPLVILLLLLLTTLAMASTTTTTTTDNPPACSKQKQKYNINPSCATGHNLHTCPWVLARDAITLSMKEVQDTMKFIDAIPKLESVGAVATIELFDCINGLMGNLGNVRGALGSLRRLHGSTLDTDAQSVNRMISALLVFESMCQQALREVDQTIVLMLHRKLVDISLTVHNVVLRVTQFQSPSPSTGGGGGGSAKP